MRRINPDTGEEFKVDEPRPRKPFPDGFEYGASNWGIGVGSNGKPLLFYQYIEHEPLRKDGYFHEKWMEPKEIECSFCGEKFETTSWSRKTCDKHRKTNRIDADEGKRRTNPDTGFHFLVDDPRPQAPGEDGKLYPQDGRLFHAYSKEKIVYSEYVSEVWKHPKTKICGKKKCKKKFKTNSVKRQFCHECSPTQPKATKAQVKEWLEKGQKPCLSRDLIKSLTGCDGIIILANHPDMDTKKKRGSSLTGRPQCNACYQEYKYRRDLKSKYGITAEEMDIVAIHQNYSCAICKIEQPKTGAYRLCVDHDKETGLVRGLICHHCNRGIGNLMHDPDNLIEASKYVVSGGLKKLAKELKRRTK